MRLVFPDQNLGEINFPSPGAKSGRNVDLRYIWNIFSSVSSSPLIHILIKSSIICESLGYWVLMIGVFSSITILFWQRNFHVLVIHELVVNLVRGGKLLDNRDLDQHISILWSSLEFLSCCPVIQLLLPRFIRAIMCFHPCVP